MSENEIQLNEGRGQLKNNLGLIGMILGILSMTICFWLGGIFGAAGLTCSVLTLKRVSAESGDPQRKMAWAGIICSSLGIIEGIISAVGLLILCVIWIRNGGFYI